LFGTGGLFANMHLLFGPAATGWHIVLIDDYKGFLLAILPPGAFIVLGLLIALKNRIDEQRAERAKAMQPQAPVANRRVRITGAIE
ncbi:electron transport complex subunit RsxE, partial [Azotobacter chroococcum]|nr:electron transport complex subunit RsxE [Azotobacter chroococcum]